MYNWGGLVETVNELDGADALMNDKNTFSECVKKLRMLEETKTIAELKTLLKEKELFSNTERNYLNSPLLDKLYDTLNQLSYWNCSIPSTKEENGAISFITEPSIFSECMNKLCALEKIKTIEELKILFTKRELEYLNSTLLNELIAYSKDVEKIIYPEDRCKYNESYLQLVKILIPKLSYKQKFETLRHFRLTWNVSKAGCSTRDPSSLLEALNCLLKLCPHERSEEFHSYKVEILKMLRNAPHIGIVAGGTDYISHLWSKIPENTPCVLFDILTADYIKYRYVIDGNKFLNWPDFIIGINSKLQTNLKICFETLNDLVDVFPSNYTFVEPINLHRLIWGSFKIIGIENTNILNESYLTCALFKSMDVTKRLIDTDTQMVQYIKGGLLYEF